MCVHLGRFNELTERITAALDVLDVSDTDALTLTGATIRGWIVHATLPPQLAEQIVAAYRTLETEYGPNLDVAGAPCPLCSSLSNHGSCKRRPSPVGGLVSRLSVSVVVQGGARSL